MLFSAQDERSTKVDEFIKSINAESVYRGNRDHFIKKNYPGIYADIFKNTKHVTTPTFAERLYCYVNCITETPTCVYCNKAQVTFSRRKGVGYHRYCSRSCSIKHVPELLGVSNVSQLDSVKDAKKESSLRKYGVENPSQADEVKREIGESTSRRWEKVYETKKFTTDGMDRREYGRRCHQYADTQYRRYRNLLDPDSKRSKHWHVDHIYSITDGFLNEVPVNIISDISNLRLISDTENYTKHKKSEKTLEQLYEDYLRPIVS